MLCMCLGALSCSGWLLLFVVLCCVCVWPRLSLPLQLRTRVSVELWSGCTVRMQCRRLFITCASCTQYILSWTYCSHEEEWWSVCVCARENNACMHLVMPHAKTKRAHTEPRQIRICYDPWMPDIQRRTRSTKKQETVDEQSLHVRNGIFCDLWHSDVPTPSYM